MSREEPPPEDRKLLSVKSWFTRSVSFGGVHGSSTAMAAAAASKGLSEGHGHNGEDQEAWGGFNPTLKQLSMRRSKASTDTDRETALGSPSMTPRNVTPLIPLTPLRWKSNPSEQEEVKAVTGERSRLGLSVTTATALSEEHSRDDSITQGSEDEQKAEQDVHVQTKPFNGFYPKVQTTAEEDEDEDESIAMEAPNGQDMKTSPGDDVMTMTIDFLRARLLSERFASKAAKQQIQELGTKVMELELKLEAVVEDKKKAEKSAEEALLKLLTGNFAQVADCTARAAQSRAAFKSTEGLHITSGSGSGGEEIKEELQWAESSFGDLSRADSIGSSSDSKDSGDSRRKSQVRNEDGNDADKQGDLWVTPKNMFVTEGESPKKQDNRAAIENRLRKMWTQISADMSALAKDGNREDRIQEQLMTWLDQVPAILQDRTPQKPVEETQFIDGQQKKLVYPQGVNQENLHFGLSPPAGIQDKRHVQADAKRSEVMLEEYEAHKRVQREWERNYYVSKHRLEQPNQQDYPRMDHKGAPKDSGQVFATAHHGVHRSKSSIDMPKSDARDGFYSDSESWGGDRHGQYTNCSSDYRQRLAYPAVMEHPHRQAETGAALSRAHESESREWHEKQLQLEYLQQSGSQGVRCEIGGTRLPLTNRERDFHIRSTANRSPERAIRSSQQDNGGAHPMWNVRDERGGLGQTHTDSDYYRLRERDSDPYRSYLQSEKKYRHGHRRSHSADSSNWPTEEDYRSMDVPHQQRNLSGEIHPHHANPRNSAHNIFDNRDHRRSYEDDLRPRHETLYGMPSHRQDKYHDVKSNMPPQVNKSWPVNTAEPKLFLGYGPGYDVPRDHSPTLLQDRVSNKTVTNVLLALQKAKASIQKSGSDRARASTEPVKPEYDMDPRAQYTTSRSPEQYHHTRSVEHDLGATRIRPSISSPSLNYHPSAVEHCSDVDQLNVGKGIQFFF